MNSLLFYLLFFFLGSGDDLIIRRAAAGGGVDDPSVFCTSLTEWHRGDLGVTETTCAVSRWDDQGNGGIELSMATSGNRPCVTTGGKNGQTYLAFDGVNDYLITEDADETDISQYYAHAMMIRLTSVVTNEMFWNNADQGGSNGQYAQVTWPQTDHLFTINSGLSINSTSDINLNDYIYMYAIYNGTSCQLWVNGTLETTGNCGTQTLDPLTLGANAFGSGAMQFHLYEHMICEDASFDTGAATIYFKDRYAM